MLLLSVGSHLIAGGWGHPSEGLPREIGRGHMGNDLIGSGASCNGTVRGFGPLQALSASPESAYRCPEQDLKNPKTA
eukprot:15468060-Alexandrium_andersonii.AAC.1